VIRFLTLEDYQRNQARITGMVAVALIRTPEMNPRLTPAFMAKRAAHYALCGGCEKCREEWEQYEAEMAAIEGALREMSEAAA
jgi:hypothetical protein